MAVAWGLLIFNTSVLVLLAIVLIVTKVSVRYSGVANHAEFLDRLSSFMGYYRFDDKRMRIKLMRHLDLAWFAAMAAEKGRKYLHIPSPVQNVLIGLVLITGWLQLIEAVAAPISLQIALVLGVIISLLAVIEQGLHWVALHHFAAAQHLQAQLVRECVELLLIEQAEQNATALAAE
ncbi:hypothetical protein [Lactiplantibacillus daowaiensis]|uniref:Integral membrane protein n=1 Tax=Lactiplantibacillus daowaiensis TaxID=2559918 RepID=A0ABW1RWF4_9LACO|nr:hypothetical protein [Lactiplantibacillus daowaiensis]